MNVIVKWMNESYFESIFAIFDEKSRLLSILDIFWALFLFDQYQWFPDYWIELSFELNQQNFLNWIIFWIESWVKQYWIDYWINHFLAKSKHWIESDRVSNTPNKMWLEIWNRFFEMKENYASPRTSWQYYARRWLMPSQVRSLQGTHNAARRVLDSVTSISGSVSEVTFFLGVVL